MAVDVPALGADFYVFTGHKLYGPTGIGVLHGREAVLDAMPPFLGGGDMIRTVTFEGSTWNDLPYKFEAGTPHMAGAVGLGAAIDYVQRVGFDAIGAHERRCSSARRPCLAADARHAPDRHGAPEGERACRSSWTASTRTTSAPSSTARASPSARATTARSR